MLAEKVVGKAAGDMAGGLENAWLMKKTNR